VKIASVKTYIVDFFRANLVLVKIETDEGLYGWGEATVEFNDEAVAAAIHTATPFLVGKDPFEINRLVGQIHRHSYFRTGVILRSALSGIEAALFDIKGKALGVPVYDLLGGKVRDEIRCYANAWFTGAKTADEFVEKAKVVVELGYTALKWDPFGSAYMDLTAAELNNAMGIVEAVKASVPKHVDIIIEGHGRFNQATALRIARSLKEFEPLWFEEPLPPENIGAVGDLRALSPVPIATGERYYDPASFQALISANAADYLQPDVCHVGGLEALKAISSMAESSFIPVAPHNPMGPVANAMNIHLAGALPAVSILETMMSDVPWRKDVCKENVTFSNGYIRISDSPGLGIEVDEEACLEHPGKRHYLRHFDGRLTDIRPENETLSV
jgi:galactonate dehydratase